MKSKFKGQIGTACQITGQEAQAATRFHAELELVRLGSKPRRLGNGSAVSIQEHIADGTSEKEDWYWLIDYRNGNKRILKKALTRLGAYSKNQFLAGTGKAWAKTG